MRLAEILSDDEYAARLGGDEFALVQKNASPEAAVELANKLASRLSAPIDWELKLIEAGVSVGVALFPDQGANRRDLLANADLAMYRGKAQVGKNVSVYDENMDQFVREQRKVAHDLKSAIQNNQLELNYQPQFDSKTEVLTGFEALLRWNCPSRGVVSPSVFIPVAEDSALINEIDAWVLAQACRLMVTMPKVPRIAVNISAKAICQPTMPSIVQKILLETGMSPSRLELEITETALILDLNRALHNLRQLKGMGITIAMDDFGTGYSSLSLLNSFPFDRIKIDKSFVDAAVNNVRAEAIIKTVIGLGTALNVPVLIEGVETLGQLKFAVEAGCEEVQGYYLGRPLAIETVGGFYTDYQNELTARNLAKSQKASSLKLKRA